MVAGGINLVFVKKCFVQRNAIHEYHSSLYNMFSVSSLFLTACGYFLPVKLPVSFGYNCLSVKEIFVNYNVHCYLYLLCWSQVYFFV